MRKLINYYQADAPTQQRQEVIEKWRRWLDKQADSYSCAHSDVNIS